MERVTIAEGRPNGEIIFGVDDIVMGKNSIERVHYIAGKVESQQISSVLYRGQRSR